MRFLERGVVARQIRLGGELGTQLREVELEVAQVLDSRLERRQWDIRRVVCLELAQLVAQLRGALVHGIALGRLGNFRGEGDCTFRFGDVLTLLGDLRFELAPLRARLGQDTAVIFELLQRLLATAHLLAQPLDIAAQDLEIAGVLGTLGPVPTDGLFQLATRGVSAAVGTAHRLLEPVAQRALVLSQAGELLMVDAGSGAEELLARQTGEPRHMGLDSGRVDERLVAESQLDRPALAGEDLAQAGALAVVHEVELDRRIGIRIAPRT